MFEYLDVMRGVAFPALGLAMVRVALQCNCWTFQQQKKTGAFEGGQLGVRRFSQTRGEKIHTVRAEVDR